jgi:hypothetical protein
MTGSPHGGWPLGGTVGSAPRTSYADRASINAELELSLKMNPSMGVDHWPGECRLWYELSINRREYLRLKDKKRKRSEPGGSDAIT